MMRPSEILASLLSVAVLSGIVVWWWFFPVQLIPLTEPKSQQQERLMLAVLAAIQPPQSIPVPEPAIEPPPSEPIIDPEPDAQQQEPQEPQEPFIATTESLPEVALADRVQPPPEPVKPVKKVIPKVTPKIKPAPPEKAVIADTPNLAPAPAPAVPSPAVTQAPETIKPQHSPPDIMAQYRAMMMSLLAKHKYYPNLSRRLYEEGTVVVRFTVQRSGQVSDVQLVTRSEFERLDSATLGIFEALQMQLPAFFAEMPEASLSFQLPMVYALH